MSNSEIPGQNNSVKKFFRDLKAEWGKITWPQKPQIVSETIIVFAVVAFFTIVVFLMDWSFTQILGLFNK